MRKWVLVLLVLAAIVSSASNASAYPEQACFSEWWTCNYEAAAEETAWRRFLHGLDCNVSLYACLREALMG